MEGVEVVSGSIGMPPCYTGFNFSGLVVTCHMVWKSSAIKGCEFDGHPPTHAWI